MNSYDNAVKAPGMGMTPARQTQISEQMALLDKNIEELANLALSLADRLGPILSPENPKVAGTPSTPELAGIAPFAETLMGFSRKINNIWHILDETRQRIEL